MPWTSTYNVGESFLVVGCLRTSGVWGDLLQEVYYNLSSRAHLVTSPSVVHQYHSGAIDHSAG